MLMNTTFLGDSFSIKWQSRGVTNPDCFRPLCHPKARFAKKELKSRKDCDKIGRRVFCAPIGIKQHQLTILKSIAG